MSKKCSPAFAFQKCFCKGEFIHSALFRTILTRLWGNPTCILRAFVYWVRNTFGLYRGFSLKGKLGFIFEHPKKVDNFKEWNNKLCAIERNELYPFQGVGCEQSLAGVWKTVKKKWIHPVFKKFNWTQSYRNLLETRWNPVWAHCLNVQTLLIDYLLLLHISVSDILLKGVLGTVCLLTFIFKVGESEIELRSSLKGSLQNIWTHKWPETILRWQRRKL